MRRTIAGWLGLMGLMGLMGLLAAAPAAAACGDELPVTARLQAEAADAAATVALAFSPRPAPVPLGRHFALDIVLCAPAGMPLPHMLSVDAEMPAHRHGMNYRATVRALGAGRFVAEGLMFHMAGRWRLRFDLPTAAGQPPLRLTREIDVQ